MLGSPINHAIQGPKTNDRTNIQPKTSPTARTFCFIRRKATPCPVSRLASGMFSEGLSRRGIWPPQPRGDREGSQEGGPCSQYAPESVLNWDKPLLCKLGHVGF